MYFLSKNMCFLWISTVFDEKAKKSGPAECFFRRFSVAKHPMKPRDSAAFFPDASRMEEALPRQFATFFTHQNSRIRKNSFLSVLYFICFTLCNLMFVNHRFALSKNKSSDMNRNYVHSKQIFKQRSTRIYSNLSCETKHLFYLNYFLSNFK